MPLKGIERVKRRYREKVRSISEEKTEAAIWAILSQGAAIADTMTPIDTGNLINSRYQPRIYDTPAGKAGNVGYTAEYAKWVHEMSGKLKGQPRAHFGETGAGIEFGGGTQVGNYWDPDAEPQFLKKGFDQVKGSVKNILRAVYNRD